MTKLRKYLHISTKKKQLIETKKNVPFIWETGFLFVSNENGEEVLAEELEERDKDCFAFSDVSLLFLYRRLNHDVICFTERSSVMSNLRKPVHGSTSSRIIV